MRRYMWIYCAWMYPLIFFEASMVRFQNSWSFNVFDVQYLAEYLKINIAYIEPTDELLPRCSAYYGWTSSYNIRMKEIGGWSFWDSRGHNANVHVLCPYVTITLSHPFVCLFGSCQSAFSVYAKMVVFGRWIACLRGKTPAWKIGVTETIRNDIVGVPNGSNPVSRVSRSMWVYLLVEIILTANLK